MHGLLNSTWESYSEILEFLRSQLRTTPGDLRLFTDKCSGFVLVVTNSQAFNVVHWQCWCTASNFFENLPCLWPFFTGHFSLYRKQILSSQPEWSVHLRWTTSGFYLKRSNNFSSEGVTRSKGICKKTSSLIFPRFYRSYRPAPQSLGKNFLLSHKRTWGDWRSDIILFYKDST